MQKAEAQKQEMRRIQRELSWESSRKQREEADRTSKRVEKKQQDLQKKLNDEADAMRKKGIIYFFIQI